MGLDPVLNPVKSVDDFRPLIHPEDVDKATEVTETAAKFIESDRDYTMTFRIIRPGGEIRWVRSAAFLQHEGGTPVRAVGVLMDVTESRVAEEKLRESYDSLRRAERLARIGSWTLDVESGQISPSEMLWELIERDPAGPPITMATLHEVVAPGGYEKLLAAVEHCVQTGEPYGIEVEIFRRNGSTMPAYVQGEAYRDGGGRIPRLTGTVLDLTEIAEAREKLAALADNLPNGAIYRVEFDRDGNSKMAYMSAGIQTLVGVPAEEVVHGHTVLSDMVVPEDREFYRDMVSRALATGEPYQCRMRLNSRHGNMVWLEDRAVLSANRADGTTIWDGILRDITLEEESANALREAKESAEKAERAKGDFLATMSHEIRTPMNTVIGMTRLTLQTDLAPRQRNYLKKVDASAKLLLSIINDILDFSKIEAGRLELEDTEFTLDTVLDAVSAATAAQAEEKGLEIAFDVAPDVPRNLRGDSLRLNQVLVNLVGNAVKFTHEGEVVVVARRLWENGAPMISLAVRDTGIGLDAKQLSGLFRPFSQADAETSRRYGGTGLGLTICKHIVECMGGTIEVQSEPGKGSTFQFAIPCRAAQEAGESAGTTHSRLQFSDRRILVVDDNASARRILAEMASSFGVQVQTAESGESGLAIMGRCARQGQPFDLVLMDWRMPELDGLETARRIRQDGNLQKMPAVLMVTAYAREEVLQGVEVLGLQGVLIKPITQSALFNAFMSALNGTGGAEHPQDGESEMRAPARQPAFESSLKCLAGRRVLVADDNPLNREVASDFLLAVGVEVDTAVDGADALRQLEQRDYDAVLMDMHMPEMDGMATTREIRRHTRWDNLPIIALTAQARTEDRDASLMAGMTGYLTKPIDESALYSTLADLFEGANQRQGSTAPGPAGESLTAAEPVQPERLPIVEGFDLGAASRRLGNNPERMWRLLRGLLDDFAPIPDGVEKYLQAGNLAGIAALAHAARGTASYFEAREFCVIAEQIERAGGRGDAGTVQRYGPLFVHLLREALQRLSEVMDQSPLAAQADFARAWALLGRAEPLVPQGDYAAQPLLDEIHQYLHGTKLGELAENLRTHFEDLDLDAAAAALEELKTRLKSEMEKP